MTLRRLAMEAPSPLKLRRHKIESDTCHCLTRYRSMAAISPGRTTIITPPSMMASLSPLTTTGQPVQGNAVNLSKRIPQGDGVGPFADQSPAAKRFAPSDQSSAKALVQCDDRPLERNCGDCQSKPTGVPLVNTAVANRRSFVSTFRLALVKDLQNVQGIFAAPTVGQAPGQAAQVTHPATAGCL